jgi:anti-anti-sigma regulatory factor
MTFPPVDPSDDVTVAVRSLLTGAVVEVSSEIDLATRDVVADSVFGQLDARPPWLVLDATKIEFMGVRGFGGHDRG